MSPFTVEKLSVESFASLQDEWSQLLAQSGANPLFSSWAWQYSWWETWGVPAGFELLLLAAKDVQGRLLGLAPLYKAEKRLKNVLPVSSIQFIGTNHDGIRTEYPDFITRQDIHDALVKAFMCYLLEHESCAEFFFADMPVEGDSHRILWEVCAVSRLKPRVYTYSDGICLDLKENFSAYLAELGKHTRLRVYNRRSLLEQQGYVEFKYYDLNKLDAFFTEMSRLFHIRWGRPIFSPLQAQFHHRFLPRLGADKLHCSALLVNGECISTLFNIRIAGTEYNVQAGFNENYHKKISLGMLHLGYAIEQAYTDGLQRFDFLLGDGKQFFYKSHFKGRHVRVCSMSLVRKPWLKAAYTLYDTFLRPPTKAVAAAEEQE